MPINVKISLCKITRASKLFQRNYYLPLLKPLSPKDALRRKVITGQNVLGNRFEHYIPVLMPHKEKFSEKRSRGKGVPVIKKRVRKHENERYVEPFFDPNMENHGQLQNLLSRKPKGKGQHYIYEVPDKRCTLVISSQMEAALKDKTIVDITMAQRSEKIVVKLSTGLKVTVPVAPFNNNVPLYRGSGWTKDAVEQEHHHGRETMSMAKLFEAKESGVEEWELEMMRMASKRSKTKKGEGSADWKMMLTTCVEDMDWEKFEDDSKQIVDEKEQTVDNEHIPMAVNDMEMTTNVAEKLKQGGQEVLDQLPTMKEIPEVIKHLESGDMCELMKVSGVRLTLPSSGKERFITGQMVKTDENEVFVPGQTILDDEGTATYTPGVTILMDGEPTLIPGLVMGEDDSAAMFLPGDSQITEDGQLKFEATEDDLPPSRRRRPPSDSPSPPPPPKPRTKYDEEIVIKRRSVDAPVFEIKERVKRRPAPVDLRRESTPPPRQFPEWVPMEDPLKVLEEQRMLRDEEERKRMKERQKEAILKEETKVDKLRIEMRKKMKELKIEKPQEYVPLEPVKKSKVLEDLEKSIKKGTFFDDDKTNEILEKAKNQTRMLKYQHVLGAYGSEFGVKKW